LDGPQAAKHCRQQFANREVLSMAPGFSSEVAPENSPVWRAGDQP
jgi:hypothetical protein